jgi:hypothetical protein
MKTHILQSQLWGKFKNEFGTPTVFAGNVLYTKHPIPFTSAFYGYCPRVNPLAVDFDALKKSLAENSCVAVHFDVPNIVKGSPEETSAIKVLEEHCERSPRDEFAKANFILDITKSEDELLAQMHNKQRYNINYAARKGVTVREADKPEDFETFFSLYKETGIRQKYYYRSRAYLEKMWTIFKDAGVAHILTAEYEGKPLAAWMLFVYDNVLYYPYGGSTEENRNLQASCLIGWEAIKLGKNYGAEVFDMWGAAEDLNNTADPYYGFTSFKAKFGASHVLYIDSYDYVINPSMYKIFNTANSLRWKLLNVLR